MQGSLGDANNSTQTECKQRYVRLDQEVRNIQQKITHLDENSSKYEEIEGKARQLFNKAEQLEIMQRQFQIRLQEIQDEKPTLDVGSANSIKHTALKFSETRNLKRFINQLEQY